MRMTLAEYLVIEQRLEKNRNAKRNTPPDLGSVETRSAEQASARPLEQGPKKRKGGTKGVGCRVSLIACRHRLLDPDAIAFSMKPLTDSVAAWLGVDDADPRVEWEWSQVKTNGTEGVLVKIETV